MRGQRLLPHAPASIASSFLSSFEGKDSGGRPFDLEYIHVYALECVKTVTHMQVMRSKSDIMTDPGTWSLHETWRSVESKRDCDAGPPIVLASRCRPFHNECSFSVKGQESTCRARLLIFGERSDRSAPLLTTRAEEREREREEREEASPTPG